MINPIDKKAYLKDHLEFINKYPNEVGSKIFELEEEFKNYFGSNYASACSSGSSGLILALKALGIGENDEVLLNCNYFISDPNSIKIVGAKPIFIDLGEIISSLSLVDIKSKITTKTKAIIIIHLYGYPIENTLEIVEFCHKNNIYVIEDCCQSIGAKIGEKYIGTLGDIGVFSFDTNKMLKGGEGGMTISNNNDLIQKIRLYKNNCKQDGNFVDLGYNFRYNDFAAIYAKYSLRNLENTINQKILEKDEVVDLYETSENIYPNYYGFIIKKENAINILSEDFYKINLDNFKNYKKHLSNYEII